ncbi:MAG: metal-dependent hydrolase [Sandaracinaceae bacterium]|nr:metal-dependent hydrolase [Sandaracinaceae bacterium]
MPLSRPSPSRPIPVRAPRFELDESVPRAWLGGSPVASHVVNALSLLFPEGERFFIRSVRHYQEQIDEDPELRARVRGFFGQEGRHGHEHDRHNRMLRAQGFELDAFFERYQRVGWDWIEPNVPPHLRLATTVALEHMTATLAEIALDSPILDDAHPEVRRLLLWHACEEIEHKSVAFDVLTRVDPRLGTRAAGLAIGAGVLLGFFALALATFLQQERALEPAAPVPRSRTFWKALRATRGTLAAAVVDYLRPDFHPDQRDNYALAVQHLASM